MPGFTADFGAFFAVAFAYLAAFFALNSAHRFLVASIMCLRPSALSLRFLGADSFLAFLRAAHRFRWAAAIRFLPAALMERLGLAPAEAAPAFGSRAPSRARTVAMLLSISIRCCSNPCRAACSTVAFNRGFLGMKLLHLSSP